MMAPASSRGRVATLLRPRFLLFLAFAAVTVYFVLFSGPAPDLHIVKQMHPSDPQSNDPASPAQGSPPKTEAGPEDKPEDKPEQKQEKPESPADQNSKPNEKPYWDISAQDLMGWRDPDDHEDPNDVTPGYEKDGTPRDEGSVSKLQAEKDMRKIWRYVYKTTANLASSNLIYGKTLVGLEEKDNRTAEAEKRLDSSSDFRVKYSVDKPVRFNPYPDYNGKDWVRGGYAPYVPCNGPLDKPVEDLFVFKGRPAHWPAPLFGSYGALGLDPNICWERETRLGPYGLHDQFKTVNGKPEAVDWNNVNWGKLQSECAKANAKRFDSPTVNTNPYLDNYPDLAAKLKQNAAAHTSTPQSGSAQQGSTQQDASDSKNQFVSSGKKPDSPKIKGRSSQNVARDKNPTKGSGDYIKEKRTAILLRTYTGKTYTENDKQVIRALISETSLRSGGKYEVFLLMHVKDKKYADLFKDENVYQQVLQDMVPPEFQSLTVLWNDQAVWDIYTEMKDDNERSVHTAQWLSVQKFSHEHPQFDYIWNWEMDFRFTGHHYDLLEGIDKFAREQPRKGIWERSDRWYIPEFHGDYNTAFRQGIQDTYGNHTVWGPPNLPFINPIGPKPPTSNPNDDDYKWGVDEDADVITTGPMFDPIHSNWIIGKHVWNYKDENHESQDLPRRSTIVTQSRISKRVLDVMHIENMRGNHVASEMTPQTVALLHGLKAVYAPHPVYMDRSWNGDFLNKWFNPGPNGTAGSYGSPMGWGRERRYQGTSWYYRAEPPNRLYNNWMGWVDTDIGGEKWEQIHGRPCLPSIMLHPVKDSTPQDEGHRTGFELAYG